MSGIQGVSTERLSSLGHVTHKGFDDLVDPKIKESPIPQAILISDLLITVNPLFYTNLLATLDMFRLNSASLTFGTTDEGNQFRRRQKLTRTKFSFNQMYARKSDAQAPLGLVSSSRQSDGGRSFH
jgi:hypothetical protein